MEEERDSCLDWRLPWPRQRREVLGLSVSAWVAGFFTPRKKKQGYAENACCSVTGLRPTVAAQSGHNLWLLFHALKYRMLAEDQMVSIWAGRTT